MDKARQLMGLNEATGWHPSCLLVLKINSLHPIMPKLYRLKN